MDRINARILHALQDNGRTSWSGLASEINLSASACQRRVESLIENGTIQNFTINLNEEKLGFPVKAFVAVNVDRQNTKLAQDFRAQIQQHPQVQACHMISGTIDFMLEVVARDLNDLGQLIDEQLLSMPAVKDASSSIVLNEVKTKRTAIL